MQLLHSSTIAVPQFVGVSVLLNPSALSGPMGRSVSPFVTASPYATVTQDSAIDAINELNSYLFSLVEDPAVPTKTSDPFELELLKEDSKLSEDHGTFHAYTASGMALHYRVSRDRSVVDKVLRLVLPQSGSEVGSKIAGVILCVGVSGLPGAYMTSNIEYSLKQRLSDCVGFLAKLSASDPVSAKSVLADYLLSEVDDRVTNEMYEAGSLVKLQAAVMVEEEKSKGLLGGKKGQHSKAKKGSKGMEDGDDDMAHMNRVLSVRVEQVSSDAARSMVERMNILSVVETDSILRKYEQTAQERKANLDLVGAKKPMLRRKRGELRDPDLDSFDYKGPVRDAVRVKQADTVSQPLGDFSSEATPATRLSLKKRDTGSSLTSRRRASEVTDETAARPTLGDAFSRRPARMTGSLQFDEESVQPSVVQESGYSAQTRLQINVALNEDLACSYKMSQLSSCTVEGVVQVQVKSNVAADIPFCLSLKDLSYQIESLTENGKYAEDISEDTGVMDRRFIVSVPKGDSYFPVVRYKCIEDLRPVPIVSRESRDV